MTPLEESAWLDFDRAAAAYAAEPCEANRAAYEAATNAAYCAVTLAIQRAKPKPVATITRTRACYFCGKVLDARAGFIETIHQPDGLRRDFCTPECLHWQLHEDEKAE